MHSRLFLAAALLILLVGCNMDENNTHKKPAQADRASDTAMAMTIPVEGQTKPYSGQYCYIKDIYRIGDTTHIDADYIQFFMGKEADAQATKHRDGIMDIKDNGDTTWSTSDGYYILNENKKIRTLNLAKDLIFYALHMDSAVYLERSDLKRLQKGYNSNNIYILTFNKDNEVSVIKDQYVP